MKLLEKKMMNDEKQTPTLWDDMVVEVPPPPKEVWEEMHTNFYKLQTNFEEFGKGKTYAHTRKRFGKRRADKQRIAVGLNNKRKSAAKRKVKTRKASR